MGTNTKSVVVIVWTWNERSRPRQFIPHLFSLDVSHAFCEQLVPALSPSRKTSAGIREAVKWLWVACGRFERRVLWTRNVLQNWGVACPHQCRCELCVSELMSAVSIHKVLFSTTGKPWRTQNRWAGPSLGLDKHLTNGGWTHHRLQGRNLKLQEKEHEKLKYSGHLRHKNFLKANYFLVVGERTPEPWIGFTGETGLNFAVQRHSLPQLHTREIIRLLNPAAIRSRTHTTPKQQAKHDLNWIPKVIFAWLVWNESNRSFFLVKKQGQLISGKWTSSYLALMQVGVEMKRPPFDVTNVTQRGTWGTRLARTGCGATRAH